MTYWLVVQLDYDNIGEHRAYALDASSMEEAVEEAQRRLVAGRHPDEFDFDAIPEYDFSDCIAAQAVVCGETADIDLEHVSRLSDALFQRRMKAEKDWNTEFERLRDELGHWRTLHARGQCPSAQVSMLEDRLQAHKNARP